MQILLMISILSQTFSVCADVRDHGMSATEAQLNYTIFNDKSLLDGYTDKYKDLSKEIILALIKDDNLTSYKSAAAIRVFKEQFSEEVVSKERKNIERLLVRRLNRADSAFVQVEIMHTLCILDRYRYFKNMIPALILKLDNPNETVNELSYKALTNLIDDKNTRSREAKIVFNTIRKVLFLSRKRLASIDKPGPKLKQKLILLRWSIKVLGNQVLKRLPNEVLNLL